MAFQSSPSTPKSGFAPASKPEGFQTPGKWRHPRLSEIIRRQDASTFDQNNARRLLWNGTTLVASSILGNSLKTQLLRIQWLRNYPVNLDVVLFALQLYLAVNVLVALYPVFRPKDELLDIPLTPTQRSLLGLNPMATPPPTPESTYATPPKYRLSGSRASSPLSKSSSPFSPMTSGSGQSYSGGKSFSPSTSPLLQKAIANGSRENGQKQSLRSPSPAGRRSFGSPSPLARSSPLKESSMSSFGPPTPSPTGKRGPGIALSNRWLYERSGRLSTSNSTFSL